MIRIRYIHDVSLPISRDCVEQAGVILRENFPDLAQRADKIPQLLQDPFGAMYRTILLVADSSLGKVMGFSLFLHLKEINSSFLDYIAVRKDARSGGIGGALYEATREYCQAIGSRGLYIEVDPDLPESTPNPAELAQRRQRMRFYENYGARPIVNNDYHLPVGDPPTSAYLLFDALGRTETLSRAEVRAAVRWILQRRFKEVVDQSYVERLVESFVDDPVCFRTPQYVPTADQTRPVVPGRLDKPFVLVSGQKHVIHHVRSRGYFERPARVPALVEAASSLGLFTIIGPRRFNEEHILAVHDRRFVNFLKVVCTKLSADRPVYPDTFPIRRSDRRPKDLPTQAGYYCIDACTPLDRNAYQAARDSVDVALTAAEEVLAGCRVAYAVCRPPGHHAERKVYGGFCYFNNAAIAAHLFTQHGRVAVLDIDFHHGNGTQDIFYERSDVLTVSIHGHPDTSFPYFSGFKNETGQGPGLGFNHNFPLPLGTREPDYLPTFQKALQCLTRFKPDFLILSFGLDILKNDPTGTFSLTPRALNHIGQRLGQLKKPILVVQEGGYNLRNLRSGSTALFTGLAQSTLT